MNNKKRILRPILLALLAIMMIAALPSCRRGQDEEEQLIQMIQNGEMTYTVIRAEGASSKIKSVAVDLCVHIVNLFAKIHPQSS